MEGPAKRRASYSGDMGDTSSDIPGQALAYKMGSRTVRELRERTRARLGASFDVRRFHGAVLSHGAMPRGVLERHRERVLTPEA